MTPTATLPRSATPAPVILDAIGRLCPAARRDSYPLTATCTECDGSIRCADGSADWVHTSTGHAACPAPTAKDEIAAIRRELRRLVPGVSVRGGRGTAYGWVEISGPGKGGGFTPEQANRLHEIGLGCGGNFAVISPDNRRDELARLRSIDVA